MGFLRQPMLCISREFSGSQTRNQPSRSGITTVRPPGPLDYTRTAPARHITDGVRQRPADMPMKSSEPTYWPCSKAASACMNC